MMSLRGAFQRTDICKFRIGDDNTDGFGSIHRRSTTDSNDKVSTSLLAGLYSRGHILNGRVRFDIRIDFIRNLCFIKKLDDLIRNMEFEKIRIRADKCLLKTSCFCLWSNIFDCSMSMVGHFIQNETICHSLASYILFYYNLKIDFNK